MTTITRRLACTVAALAMAVPVLAQAPVSQPRPRHSAHWAALSWLESFQARQGPEQTERITKTFKVGSTGSLDVSSISGDVVVNEAGGDTITIEAVKRVRSRSTDEAKRQLANTNVLISQTGSRVEAKINYVGRENHASVDFTVSAPAGTQVNARSISGNVRVSGIKGEVRVESVSGDVTASGTPNLSLIKTVSGDLELGGVSGRDVVNVSTISGNLTLRSIKAREVNAESVSGEMRLSDMTCDRVSVKSVSGDVEYAGTLVKGGRYELKSHSGDIRLTMPTDVGFELEANTFSGSVRSDLPVTSRAGDSIMGGGPGRRHGLRGTHGDGSVLLQLNTFSGDITIAKGR